MRWSITLNFVERIRVITKRAVSDSKRKYKRRRVRKSAKSGKEVDLMWVPDFYTNNQILLEFPCELSIEKYPLGGTTLI